ncbi:MAG TPA: hypothetical protein VGB63_17060 [Pedobacter sp.]|jgi:hypothetical protein
MKKIIFSCMLTGFLLLVGSNVNAQYKNALGVRLGDAYGITYKTFIQSDRALDFILNARKNNLSLTGLYEVHNPINGAEGLRWYYGGGGSVGSSNYKNDDDRDNGLYLSVDGVLGLDYVVPGAPLNLSLDWKPALVLTPYTGFYERGVGLSIRIIL